MNHPIARVLSLLVLLTMPVSAGVFPPQKGDIAATIPFPFLVGSQTMEAGEYLVRLDPASSRVEICEDGVYCQAVQTAAVEKEQQASQPRIVFRRHGDRYSFVLLWPGQGAGYRVTAPAVPVLSGDSDPDYELTYVEGRPLCIHRHEGLDLARTWH